MPSTGVGLNSLVFGRPLGGGSPAPPYETGAVQFDGATELVNSSITGPATVTVVASSAWYFLAENPTTTNGQKGIWVARPDSPADLYGSYVYKYSDATIYAEGDLVADGGDSGSFTWETSPTAGAWHHILRCFDVEGTPVGFGYYDGVPMDGNGEENYGPGGVVTLAGTIFKVGNFNSATPDFWPGALADVWIAAGQTLLEEDGTISAETLAKFRDPDTGLPVYLGADGSLPTGQAPTVFMRATPGNEAATFPINRGNGGAFVLTGTLTAAVAP